MDNDNIRQEFLENDPTSWEGLASGFMASSIRSNTLPMRHEPTVGIMLDHQGVGIHVVAQVFGVIKEESPSVYPKVIMVHICDSANPTNIAKASAEIQWNHDSGTHLPTIVETQYFPNATIGVDVVTFRRIINDIGARLEQPDEI